LWDVRVISRGGGGGILTSENYAHTVEPHIMATLLTQAPHYFGHFILARTKAQLVNFFLKNPFNMATPLTQPNFCKPLVTRLTGFCCTLIWEIVIITLQFFLIKEWGLLAF